MQLTQKKSIKLILIKLREIIVVKSSSQLSKRLRARERRLKRKKPKRLKKAISK